MGKKGIFFIVISVIVLVSAANLIMGQRIEIRGAGGWGMENEYSRMYDPKTIETINGEVESIGAIKPKSGMSCGVCLKIKNGKEIVPVHLGPEWFIENQDVAIEPLDDVEVKGSKITLDGEPALIAAEIKKGEKMMILRDNKGFPRWSCWRSARYN